MALTPSVPCMWPGTHPISIPSPSLCRILSSRSGEEEEREQEMDRTSNPLKCFHLAKPWPWVFQLSQAGALDVVGVQ